MKRYALASLALLASMLVPPTAAAQAAPAGCQFVLGFKTLHDLDPQDIGDCLDNQSYAANGDAQQHTLRGLMAWRKADNWTAFTNGYTTWLNGPSGLVNRLNTDRFPWEKDTAAAPASTASSAALAAGSPANVGGAWRLVNNQAVYSINQDGIEITISPTQLRMCTSDGQSTVPAAMDVKSVKSPMNLALTGTMSGNVISGNWLVCATSNQSWVPVPIELTLSPDGNHLTGQLQETLTFDRM